MTKLLAGAMCALLLLAAPATTAEAAFCKTLKGEWVGFGEGGTRTEAESRLDKEIAAWREHHGAGALTPKDRKVGCHIYIEALNEYFCTAQATVCR